MVKVLTRSQHHSMRLFVSKRCSGGLFLQDTPEFSLNPNKPFMPIGLGWSLTDLVSAGSQNTDKDLFKIRAKYVTGVGLSGSTPFNVEIDVLRTASGWTVAEPAHLDRNFDRPTRLKNGLILVESKEQLEILGIDHQHRSYTTFQSIDYSKQRLAIKPITLTSGSIRISDIFVYLQNNTYYLGHELTSPRIGTTDMHYTSIWYLLPKNSFLSKTPLVTHQQLIFSKILK